VSADLVRLLAETHDDPRAFAERHPRVLIRSCHGAGKTALAAALSLWFTATRPHSRGLTTGPTWGAVEGVFWVELARLYGGSLLARACTGRLLTTELSFAPGWDLVGLSTDHPVNLEGRHSPTAAVRIVDEAKAVDPAVFESTEALLDAPETLDVWISTPSIPSGPFFSRDTNGGAGIIRAVVTIDDLIAEGLEGKAEWKAARLEEWGQNSPEFESRCMARYVSDAEGALFPFAWITRAESAGFEVNLTPTAGLDVAGSIAGDASALALVSGPDGQGRFQVRSVTSWHERESAATQGRALHLAREAGCKVLAVDTVGVGFGVHGAMKAEKGIGIASFKASAASRQPDRFVNTKAEIAWQLRTLLEAGKVALVKHDALRRELLAMRYQITAQGKIKTVDPSDSPDLVDAVLIALAVSTTRGDPHITVVYRRGAPSRMRL
jgi:phage terminase large subunit